MCCLFALTPSIRPRKEVVLVNSTGVHLFRRANVREMVELGLPLPETVAVGFVCEAGGGWDASKTRSTPRGCSMRNNTSIRE
jgi:hypothetical protein